MQMTIIGAGKMGEALARGIISAGLLSANEMIFSDKAIDATRKLAKSLQMQATDDNLLAVRDSEIVVLAVKPAVITEVCKDIAEELAAGCTVLSIAAGVTLAELSRVINRDDICLARAMPNTPCLVGQGAIGLSFLAEIPSAQQDRLQQLLSATGLVITVPEGLLNAVTGLSGSGPAYVAIFIEALADGGVLMGLPREQAMLLALQTVLGTAALIQQTGMHPGEVKDAVTSPGGTTIAAVQTLEEYHFRAAAIAAVQTATERASQMAADK